MWIDGTASVENNSLEKHIKGELHKRAGHLELKWLSVLLKSCCK